MGLKDSIFVVIAEDGEFSDYTTWIAAAYFTKEEAMGAKNKLEVERDELRKARNAWFDLLPKNRWGVVSLCGEHFDKVKKEHGDIPYSLLEADEYSITEIPIKKIGRYWPDENS